MLGGLLLILCVSLWGVNRWVETVADATNSANDDARGFELFAEAMDVDLNGV